MDPDDVLNSVPTFDEAQKTANEIWTAIPYDTQLQIYMVALLRELLIEIRRGNQTRDAK